MLIVIDGEDLELTVIRCWLGKWMSVGEILARSEAHCVALRFDLHWFSRGMG